MSKNWIKNESQTKPSATEGLTGIAPVCSKDVLAALKRLIAANHALGEISENRVTYYEDSPLKNPECCRRWEELNNALAEAVKAANHPSKNCSNGCWCCGQPGDPDGICPDCRRQLGRPLATIPI